MPVRVHIRNFQSIRSADLEVKGLTVVTGTNNSGKTACQRAVSGVFQNTGGTAFIRHGTEKCSVEIVFDDRKVVWEKGTKTRPTYIVDGGLPLFPGQAVPDEVQALGVRPIVAGGQEIWPTIAPQFSGQVFLIDKPGSVLAEAVADVERVGQLNQALRAAESDRRSAAAELKIRQADLVTHEAEVERFNGLDAAVEAVAGLETDAKKLDTLKRAIEGITSLRGRLSKARAEVVALEGIREVRVPDDDVTVILDGLTALRGLQRRLVTAKAQVAKYEGFAQVDLPVEERPKKLLEGLEVLYALRSRMAAAALQVTNCESELLGAQEDAQKAEAEAQEALAELGQCPTCGTLKGEHACSS